MKRLFLIVAAWLLLCAPAHALYCQYEVSGEAWARYGDETPSFDVYGRLEIEDVPVMRVIGNEYHLSRNLNLDIRGVDNGYALSGSFFFSALYFEDYQPDANTIEYDGRILYQAFGPEEIHWNGIATWGEVTTFSTTSWFYDNPRMDSFDFLLIANNGYEHALHATIVPEPSTIVLLGLGIFAAALARRKKLLP